MTSVSLCSREDAVNALRRYRNNGVALEPDNPAHISAYQVMRQTMARVDAKKLLQYINNANVSISHGGECYQKFWGVPKENFAGGLPPALAKHVYSPDFMATAEMLASGGSIDHDNYYVVDKLSIAHCLVRICAHSSFGLARPPL